MLLSATFWLRYRTDKGARTFAEMKEFKEGWLDDVGPILSKKNK